MDDAGLDEETITQQWLMPESPNPFNVALWKGYAQYLVGSSLGSLDKTKGLITARTCKSIVITALAAV
ncbi:MAG: hypothetical protein CYPHOPRED_004765, partial [Cyphobasidiales sp. Tagirdzhanova-0007]